MYFLYVDSHRVFLIFLMVVIVICDYQRNRLSIVIYMDSTIAKARLKFDFATCTFFSRVLKMSQRLVFCNASLFEIFEFALLSSLILI